MVTIVLLGALAGVVASLVVPKTYGARAEILYSITASQQGDDPLRQDRQLSTQLVLLKNRAVLGPIAQKQDRRVDDLSKDIDVSVLANSSVIQIEAHGDTQQAAMQTLQAVVDGYLAVASQPHGVVRNLGIQLDQARQNTAQLQTRVQQLRTEVLAGTTPQSTLDDARAQLTASLDWEKALQSRISELELSGQGGPAAQVLTPPYPLPDPTSPQWLISAGIGALVGVMVAGVMLGIGALRAKPAGTRAGEATSPGS
jgi:uncharacterized protein involved in exopolysaccharide biosynthesis